MRLELFVLSPFGFKVLSNHDLVYMGVEADGSDMVMDILLSKTYVEPKESTWAVMTNYFVVECLEKFCNRPCGHGHGSSKNSCWQLGLNSTVVAKASHGRPSPNSCLTPVYPYRSSQSSAVPSRTRSSSRKNAEPTRSWPS